MSMPVWRHAVFWLLGVVVFFLAVFLFRGILLPFVAGMATAYFLDPVCDRLERMGMTRTLATVIVTAVFLVLVVLTLALLVPTLVGQAGSFLERVPGYLEVVRAKLAMLVAALETRFEPELLDRAREAAAGSIDRFVTWVTRALANLVTGGVAFANFLSLLVITPIVAFYLLRDWDRMTERVDSWLPRRQAPVIREQLGLIDETLAGFVRGQATVCMILGVFYAVGLTLAGLDFGLVIGLTAGLISFVPYVGSMVGGLLSIGLALVQFDEFYRVLIVGAIFALGQAVEGNFLTPKLVGDRVGLHPVWVIFALLAGGALFGFVGILIALPVAATIGVLVRFALQQYLASGFYHGGPAHVAAAGEAEAPDDDEPAAPNA